MWTLNFSCLRLLMQCLLLLTFRKSCHRGLLTACEVSINWRSLRGEFKTQFRGIGCRPSLGLSIVARRTFLCIQILLRGWRGLDAQITTLKRTGAWFAALSWRLWMTALCSLTAQKAGSDTLIYSIVECPWIESRARWSSHSISCSDHATLIGDYYSS